MYRIGDELWYLLYFLMDNVLGILIDLLDVFVIFVSCMLVSISNYLIIIMLDIIIS